MDDGDVNQGEGGVYDYDQTPHVNHADSVNFSAPEPNFISQDVAARI